jgi:hypothetical protein
MLYAGAGISIFQDVIILLLPIPELMRLSISTRKRYNIIIMFSLGTLFVLQSFPLVLT